MSATVEVKFTLAEETLHRLQAQAQQWGVAEAAVVEQALGLLFAQADPSPVSDYWFSVNTMQEDWDAMPEDWFVVEVEDGTSTR